MKLLDIAIVHFRAVDLRYFDAAWYALSRQDFSAVRQIVVYDNDTDDPAEALHEVVNRYPVPVPVSYVFDKHRDPNKRSQSYSVNAAVRATTAPFVLFTRSDYILDFSLVTKFWSHFHPTTRAKFVTSYAYHMAYDERGDQRIVGMRDIEPTEWRTKGAQVLLEHVNGWRVDSSDRDAGVWMTTRETFERAGGLNEDLRAWGLQQTVFQQMLFKAGVEIIQIPEFLFFHQHHGGEFRDYDKAIEELERYWGPKEDLRTFRDISQFVGRVNDETPRT